MNLTNLGGYRLERKLTSQSLKAGFNFVIFFCECCIFCFARFYIFDTKLSNDLLLQIKRGCTERALLNVFLVSLLRFLVFYGN